MLQNIAQKEKISVLVQNALDCKVRKEFDKAINIYEKLIAIQANNPTFYDELAQVLAQKGTLDKAIENYKKALDLGIGNKFWTYKNLGDALKQENKFNEAIEAYQTAISLNPDNANVYNALAGTQSLIGDFPAAITNYQKALQLGIGNKFWTYKNLGNALTEENKYEEAISIYKQALKIQPNNSTIATKIQALEGKLPEIQNQDAIWQQLHDRGDNYFQQEMWQEAIASYQKAIELNPHYFWSYYNLGRVYSKLQEWQEAVVSYQKALEIEPDTSEIKLYLALAEAQKEIGDDFGRIDSYQKIISLYPDRDASIYSSYAQALNATGQTQKAIKIYQQAIEKNQELWFLYYYLGKIFYDSANWIEASSNLQKAIQLQPKFYDARVYLGDAFSNLGMPKEALQAYENARKINPRKQDLLAKIEIVSKILDEKKVLNSNTNSSNIKIFPKLSDREFISQAFCKLLIREVGDNEISLLLGRLTNSSTFTRGSILESILKSEEFAAKLQARESSPTTDYLVFSDKSDEEFMQYLYITFLKRSIDTEALNAYLQLIETGTSRTVILESILKSEEFAAKLQVTPPPTTDYLVFGDKSDEDFMQYLYVTLLKRSIDTEALTAYLQLIEKGTSRAIILESILKSDEFKTKSQATPPPANTHLVFSDKSDEEFMQYLYVTFLKRPIDAEALKAYLQLIERGTSRTVILESILKSEEFQAVNKQHILEDLSDYEFLHVIWEIILGEVCNINAERQHLKLFDSGMSRGELLMGLIKSPGFKQRVKEFDFARDNNNSNETENGAWILGTDKYINQEQWNEILLDVLLEDMSHDININSTPQEYEVKSPLVKEYLASNNLPLVSIITSLYKGIDYIYHFMENITSQTMFAGCELIIIDADSPEGEYEIIKEYEQKYHNIKYIRTEDRISIYDAWNLGVRNATGKFCTNANLDDLRRYNCLEKQAEALLKNPDFDLVYQDVYYTFTPNLPFAIIEKCNIQSKLPMATRANMLQFNSPHNAPMWRKSLHDTIGFFNAKYKSAGDYEMWLRALIHGSKFLKIEEPLAAYYNNPFGLSTRSETKGVSEAIDIKRVYIKLFGNNVFSLSKKDFVDLCMVNFGEIAKDKIIELLEKWQDKESFLEGYFNHKLKNIASEKKYIAFTK